VIYRLRFDRENYMLFDIPPHDLEYTLGDIFLLDNPKSIWTDFWKPLSGRFNDWSEKKNVLKIPDITCWFTDNLVLNQKSYDLLVKKLSSYGEFLPVNVEGVPYWILHVNKFTDMDMIDEKNSKRFIDAAECINLERLVFREEGLNELLLFKTAWLQKYILYRKI
jgi:hypothetical protein